MRRFLIFIAFSLIFTACNSHDDLSKEENLFIRFFNTFQPTAASRAIIPYIGNGSQILSTGYLHVYAKVDGNSDLYINDDLDLNGIGFNWDWNNYRFPFFLTLQGTGTKDYAYNYNSKTGKAYQWPGEPTKKVKFYSHYVQNDVDRNYIKQNDETSYSSISTNSNFVYTLDSNPANQCDFLMAEPLEITTSAGLVSGVNFEYRHTMAMIQFDFVSDIKENNYASVKLLSFNSKEQGTIDISSNSQSMTVDATSSNITVSYNPNLSVRKVANTSSYTPSFKKETSSLIFPSNTNIAAKLTIAFSDSTPDKTYDIVLTSPSGQFLAGHVYQYTLIFIADAIELLDPVVLTDWVEVDDVNSGDDIDIL